MKWGILCLIVVLVHSSARAHTQEQKAILLHQKSPSHAKHLYEPPWEHILPAKEILEKKDL